jgi:hypothetical protein
VIWYHLLDRGGGRQVRLYRISDKTVTMPDTPYRQPSPVCHHGFY